MKIRTRGFSGKFPTCGLENTSRQAIKITCIQLDGEFPDFCDRLVMPDYGLPLIGTVLSEAGYDVKVYIEHIKPPEWDRIAQSDFICFSSLSAAADRTRRLASEIRTKLRIPTIIGGTHATYFPESCLDFCDYVVLGEGDETILELIETLAGEGDVGKVPGIAYRIGERFHQTSARPGVAEFDTVPNLALIEGYRRMSALQVLLHRKKPMLTAQSSRGCPHRCTFCIVNTMFPGGYRKRNIDSVIRDLTEKRRYGRELMFVDNEFTAMSSHTKKLLLRMIEEGFDFEIVVFTRVEVVNDDDLLSLMRRAGVKYIYQGYESVNQETLVAYEKRQTLQKITAAINKLHSFGFGILGSFVLGADTDTLETVSYASHFVVEQRLSNAYFFPLWGLYPEKSRGYQTIIPVYRSIFRGWGYLDGHYVTHFPLRMPPSKLQLAIMGAYRTIYSPAQILHALKDGKFAEAKWKALLGHFWRNIEKGLHNYVPFLEELEDGLYDSEGRLKEELLKRRVRVDPRWTFQAGNRTLEALGLAPVRLTSGVERRSTCNPMELP